MENLITKEGYNKLIAERDRLEKEIDIIKKQAGESLSLDGWHENGAFETANQKYEVLLAMYADIIQQIKESKVVKPTKSRSKTKQVIFGSTVTLKIGKQSKIYTLLGDADSNVAKGIISVNSPLAKAILNKKVGDKIKFLAGIVQIIEIN